eukprot:NODE_287_length_11752_cov_0.494036.p2 type:complete len:443 gc:universal NODE_287_length_11752_cov_0.494036:1731-3059(+)
MSISSGLQLAQLNDYLQPSTACVKPAEVQTELSLDDCLACSGCITSAETMLVNMQTTDQLMEELKLKNERYCVISTQSVIAIAIHFQLDVQEAWLKLNTFVSQYLHTVVKDVNQGRMISLRLTAEELIRKSKSSTLEAFPKGKMSEEQLKSHFMNAEIPMFVSACPGWVCYAEKTHPYLIPLLSTTKSPQQCAGVLTKHIYAKDPNDTYTFCVMPCYDKKLESARPFHRTNDIKDVDLVLTTAEFLKLIKSINPDFKSIKNANSTPLNRTIGAGSGGYSEYVFLYVLNKVYNIPLKSIATTQYKDYDIRITNKKGSDLREFELRQGESLLFKVVAAFGFRHIQNVVRNLKRKGTTDCSFYEVMACPSGCLNGGGQLNVVGERTVLSPHETKSWIKTMIDEYNALKETDVSELEYSKVAQLLSTQFMTIEEREATAVDVVNTW